MDLAHHPTKILVSGNAGSGKSTFATAVLLNSRQTYKFIFDQEGESQLRLGFAPAHDAEGLAGQLAQGWVIFDPWEMFPDDLDQAFDWFCSWCFDVKEAMNQEDADAGRPFSTALFFVDELQNLVETHQVPRGLRAILERGRRQGIDTLLVTQQPNVIHNRTRNQITEIVAFSQVDQNAVDFLEDLGFDGDDVRALPVGHWRLLNMRQRKFQWGRIKWKPPTVIVEGEKSS
jgi:hypothetical protein